MGVGLSVLPIKITRTFTTIAERGSSFAPKMTMWLPVDSSGDLSALDMDVRFDDAVQLSAALAESPRVQDCVSRQWLRYALGHDIRPSDLASLDEVAAAFRASDGAFRELVLAIVRSPSFLTREVTR